MKASSEAHEKMRCGAKNRAGLPCQRWPLAGRRRCRLHGGCSTGPKTPEGLARIIAARTIHGRRSKEAQESQRQTRQFIREAKELIRQYGSL
jgi:hypothetical protein